MKHGVAVIPTAPERTRNRDAHYPYRFDSYFYYLTGFREPEAVLVVIAGDREASCSAAKRTKSAKSGTASATGPKRRAPSSASMKRTASPGSTS